MHEDLLHVPQRMGRHLHPSSKHSSIKHGVMVTNTDGLRRFYSTANCLIFSLNLCVLTAPRPSLGNNYRYSNQSMLAFFIAGGYSNFPCVHMFLIQVTSLQTVRSWRLGRMYFHKHGSRMPIVNCSCDSQR